MSDYEQERLAVLRSLNLLDTPPSESFDRITRMASQLFRLPIAAVSLTDSDRQWFKSRVGVDHWEIPRFKACCGEVSDCAGVVIIKDLQASDIYHDSPLAKSGIRFYAGAPLLTHDGYTLGAMCVLGHEPRDATNEEIAALKDMAAMVMAQIELKHAVGRVDAVTGLPNFNQFADDVEDLGRDRSGERCFALSTEVVDYSQAGALQRVMGPSYLDQLTRAAGRRLQELIGEERRLYHLGSGQFAHLEEGTEEAVLARAEALQAGLLELDIGNASPFMLRPVVGIAPLYLGKMTPADALRTAHSACRDARDNEETTGLYSAASDASHRRRFSLIGRFHEALAAGDQLYLNFQPRISLEDGRCVGAEALLRWHHPDLGEISPGEFIPLVEKTPLARQLTDWVLREAIRQATFMIRDNPRFRLSVNVAAANLEEPDFAERFFAYLAEQALPMENIELELTETSLVSKGRAAAQQLQALTEAGARIAIDDFGTGYSGLAYLQRIPADVVKIDRSFIMGLEDQPASRTLVRSMITMAHDLGYSVVAEGVETGNGLAFVQTLGCDEVQGYLIARPMGAEEFSQWLKTFLNPEAAFASA